LREPFQFIVNGTVIETDISEAAAVFPAVREQLLVDGCARKFLINNSGIEAADIFSFQLLLSGESISIGQSLGLLSRLLGNVIFELLFLDCSKADNRMNLSELMKQRRIDLESAVLSVEALDNLLLSEFVTVESEDALLEFILKLGLDYRDLLKHIQLAFLSEDGFGLLDEHFKIPSESVWQCAAQRIAHSPLRDSLIISGFPEIFAEFRGKDFKILWRGSRDGFTAQEFHRRCDGHPNTLTVILDTKGNIFGGFTPVKWESQVPNDGEVVLELDGGFDELFRDDYNGSSRKTVDSLKSFLFTLKNPHNIPAKRFALKAKEKQKEIWYGSEWGPCFGSGYDIAVSDNCNANAYSFTSLGSCYTNDTGLSYDIVFTGSKYFQAREIEVFEVTD
jgi:hypothetical protein